MVTGRLKGGEMSSCWSQVQTSSHKMSKLWRCKVWMVTAVNNTVLPTYKLPREESYMLSPPQENGNYMSGGCVN